MRVSVTLIVGLDGTKAEASMERVPVVGEWVVFDGSMHEVTKVIFKPSYFDDLDFYSRDRTKRAFKDQSGDAVWVFIARRDS
jgi:hypothetical protein